MKDRCVFIHTNERQWLGALVAEYSFRRNSAHADEFDVQFIHTKNYPYLAAKEGQTFLRGGTTRVWQMDDLTLRVDPWYLSNFGCVTSSMSITVSHPALTAESIVFVISKFRAAVRPTHGEIHVIKSDSLSAMKSRAVDEYAADESATPAGDGFLITIAAGGVHEGVARPEALFGKAVPMANSALRTAGKKEKYFAKAFYCAEAALNF